MSCNRSSATGCVPLLTGSASIIISRPFSAFIATDQTPDFIVLDVDVADRCRAPVESLAATYLVSELGRALATRSLPAQLVRLASPGPTRGAARTVRCAAIARSSLTRPPSGDACVQIRPRSIPRPHPAAALSLALDEQLAISPDRPRSVLRRGELERAFRPASAPCPGRSAWLAATT